MFGLRNLLCETGKSDFGRVWSAHVWIFGFVLLLLLATVLLLLPCHRICFGRTLLKKKISLGGRLISAHRQQLRLVDNCSNRRFTPVLFERDSQDHNHDLVAISTASAANEQAQSDEEDFYGFAAESNIFRAPVQSSATTPTPKPASSRRKRKNPEVPVWRSKRIKHLNKDSDYVYY